MERLDVRGLYSKGHDTRRAGGLAMGLVIGEGLEGLGVNADHNGTTTIRYAI
ncbi:MAG: hypothetical protein ACE5OR_09260 [bacterium]